MEYSSDTDAISSDYLTIIIAVKMHIVSKACCSRPPITLSNGYGYRPNGEYVDFNGMKTCMPAPSFSKYHILTVIDVTGRPGVKRGIFLFYDVFGLYIQALKGADILAMDYEQYPDGAGDFQVFMPDWWGENPQDLSIFPPKTPHELEKIMAFFDTGPANPGKIEPTVQPIFDAIQARHPEITQWAVMGFCWGGKMTVIFSQPGTLFKVAAQCHPSLVDPNDVAEVKIPMAILPSMDEDAEVSAPTVKKVPTSL